MACPGPVDCSGLTVIAKDYKGLLDQPAAPKFKGALCQIFVRSQPYGGSDKSNNGHRYLGRFTSLYFLSQVHVHLYSHYTLLFQLYFPCMNRGLVELVELVELVALGA